MEMTVLKTRTYLKKIIEVDWDERITAEEYLKKEGYTEMTFLAMDGRCLITAEKKYSELK